MRRAVAVLLSACLVLFAAACGGGSNGASSSTTATTAAPAAGDGGGASGGTADAGKITIGVPVPAAQFFPAFLAEKEGIFKKHGLDVDVKIIPSAQLLSSLVSGSIQFAVTSGPQMELGALKGPIKMLADWANRLDAYVVAAPGIKTMQDLRGKRMGISVPGALTSVFAKYAIIDAGMTPDQDVRIVPLGSSSPTKSFISKQIDATVAAPPLTLLETKGRPGSSLIYSFRKLPWTSAPLGGYMPWVEKHREATVELIRALNEGLQAWNDDPKAAKAVIAEQAQTTDPDIIKVSYDSTQKVFLQQVEPITAELESSVLGVLAKVGLTQSVDRAADIVDSSYAKEAMAGNG